MVIGQCVSGFGSIKDNHIYEIGNRKLVDDSLFVLLSAHRGATCLFVLLDLVVHLT